MLDKGPVTSDGKGPQAIGIRNMNSSKRVVSEPDLRQTESVTSHAHAKTPDRKNHKSLPKLFFEFTL